MKPAPPFSCSFTPNLPELLYQLKCTLVISTYQAGKVVFISATDENNIVQLPRTFDRAMGIALEGNKMAIGTRNEVIVLVNSEGLAKSYPKMPETYDGMFLPRLTYYTGYVDIHDLHWGNKGLWAINSSFSCLALIDENYSWTPKWQPPFIDELASEDRCHLNGLAMQDGKPQFVTALGNGNTVQSWRKQLPDGGILMHVESSEILLQNLNMPHSPRIFDGELYLLLSAKGALVKVNTQTGSYEIIKQLNGFVRGMAKYGDYVFIGLSRLRKNASTFKNLPIAQKAKYAGIVIIHLPTGAKVAELQYQTSVDEIYDVQILPELRRPGILNTISKVHTYSISIPQATFWADLNG